MALLKDLKKALAGDGSPRDIIDRFVSEGGLKTRWFSNQDKDDVFPIFVMFQDHENSVPSPAWLRLTNCVFKLKGRDVVLMAVGADRSVSGYDAAVDGLKAGMYARYPIEYGTLCWLWYNGKAGWHLGTSRDAYATDSAWRRGTGENETFGEAFGKAIEGYDFDLDKLDKRMTYSFVVRSPKIHLYTDGPEEYKIWFIGARQLTLGLDSVLTYPEVGAPRQEPLDGERAYTEEEIAAMYDNLGKPDAPNLGWILRYQGKDDTLYRCIHLKTLKHHNIDRLLGQCPDIRHAMIEANTLPAAEIDVLLGYVPKLKVMFDRARKLYELVAELIVNEPKPFERFEIDGLRTLVVAELAGQEITKEMVLMTLRNPSKSNYVNTMSVLADTML